jgi:hypothetical protein
LGNSAKERIPQATDAKFAKKGIFSLRPLRPLLEEFPAVNQGRQDCVQNFIKTLTNILRQKSKDEISVQLEHPCDGRGDGLRRRTVLRAI